MGTNTETQAGQRAGSERICPKWGAFIKARPSRLGDLCRRAGRKGCKSQSFWVTPRKQCLPDTTEGIHIKTYRDCGGTHMACTGKPDGVPALRGESGHRVPPRTKAVSTAYTCWERGSQFSPMETHCLYQPHSGQTPVAMGIHL